MAHYIDEDKALVWENDGAQLVLVVEREEQPDSPREDRDQYDHMICWHQKYSLGDKHKYETPYDCLIALCTKFVPDFAEDHQSFEWLFDKLSQYVVMQPIYLYDHSGLTISTSNAGYPYNDRWDAGQVGWVWIDKDTILNTIGIGTENTWRNKAAEFIQGSVDEYDTYLRGEVYRYALYKRDDSGKLEQLDSCCNFYGDDLIDSGLADTVGMGLTEALENEAVKEVDIPRNEGSLRKYFMTCLEQELNEQLEGEA